MYQITINDPKVYQAGEIFAKENHSTLEELVNRYVASLAADVLSPSEKESICQNGIRSKHPDECYNAVWQEVERDCWQTDLGGEDETMDLETARALVHETIHKVYAQ